MDHPIDNALQKRIHNLKKVELHLHLEGSISPENVIDLANKNHLRLPTNLARPEQIYASYLQYKSFRDFVNILLLGVHCLQTPQDFYHVMKQIGQRLAAENIIYAELTWTPQFYLSRQCGLDNIFHAMNLARKEIETEFGILIRWIPDLVRSYPKPAPVVIQWLLQKIRDGGSGIVALGLGGPESGHPAERFKELFQAARQAGLPANPHAGENAGADSVQDTLKFLQPKRIGHGVRAVEDAELLIQLAQKKVHLEVCLSSNVQLQVCSGFNQHPLRRLLDAGCELSLNTDDPVLFHTTLNAEYLHALQDCGMHWHELIKSIEDALNASYLDPEEKTMLKKRLQLNTDI